MLSYEGEALPDIQVGCENVGKNWGRKKAGMERGRGGVVGR